MRNLLRSEKAILVIFVSSVILLQVVLQTLSYRSYKTEILSNMHNNSIRLLDFISRMSVEFIGEYDLNSLDNISANILNDRKSFVKKVVFYDDTKSVIHKREIKATNFQNELIFFERNVYDVKRDNKQIGQISIWVDPSYYLNIIHTKFISTLTTLFVSFFTLLLISYVFFKKLAVVERNIRQNAKLVAVGQMSASVAHEVKNPLAIILGETNRLKGLLDLIKTDNFQEQVSKAKDYVENINLSSQRILHVVKKINSFSHYDNDSDNELEELDIVELINKIFKSMEVTTEDSKTKFLLDIPPEFQDKSINIVGNELLIFQAVSNLVNNALDAVRESGDKVVLGLKLDEYNSELIVYVKDNGPGIPKDIQRKIFRKFFTTKKVGAGTGLGLDIVKRIVESRLFGKLDFTSDEKEGTEFFIRLKGYKIANKNIEQSNKDDQNINLQYENKQSDLRLDNVLVVEDEEMMRDILGDLIEQIGFVPHFAANGLEGIEQLKYRKYHSVIVDLEMPKMNGEEFITYISDNNLKDFNLILSSAHSDISFNDHSNKRVLDIVDYSLSKPVSVERLNDLFVKINKKSA